MQIERTCESKARTQIPRHRSVCSVGRKHRALNTSYIQRKMDRKDVYGGLKLQIVLDFVFPR
jgi:hypothetical protein